ncbi:MAG TPA: CRTAC1 family protein [Bryobacteraceae bacterium]|nr:CRTAC1 family protein [Bryobacteraceae bacterium]
MKRVIFLAAAVLAGFAASRVPPISFEEISNRAGIQFITRNSATPQKYQPEPMVAGVAVFDYDGDGYPDLYFVNGGGMPSLTRDGPAFSNRLYRNNHDLTFTDVTDRAGVAGAGYGMGVAIGDYDNDGRPDIYLASLTGNQLFHNNGDGTFTDVTAKAGVGGGLFSGKKMWSVAAAWLDYNNDGLLDLFVSNYCQWEPGTDPECRVNEQRVYCSPRYYKPLPSTLYRNNGDGTFTDVSTETGIAQHPGRGMGVAVADYDGDGFPDIFVANDAAPNQLFHNLGGKRFEEVAEDQMTAFAEHGRLMSGMGADFRDVMNTGRPAIWLTALEQQTFPLFLNSGKGFFEDETAKVGLSGTSSMAGWSNAIVDLDNDGWKDLIVARSNVTDNIAQFAHRTYEEPLTVFHNLGNGRFEDVSAAAGPAFQVPSVYRGLAFGDFDNDGRIDVAVTVLNGAARVFRNNSQTGNHWLLLQLAGTRSNRMGIGARIRLTASDGSLQYNHASTSNGYASSSDPRVHFGLGRSSSARSIEIQWPSGARQVLHDVQADKVLQITEPGK